MKHSTSEMTIKTQYGNLTAPKSLLNLISIYASKAEDIYNERGHDALAEQAIDLSALIYDELDKTGYYEEAKEKYND